MNGSAEAVAMAQHFIKERLKEIEAHNAARAAGQPPPPQQPHQPPPSMAPPQGYAQQPYQQHGYMQQGYGGPAHATSPFLQHGMPPGMPMTMPQSNMNTMFAGQAAGPQYQPHSWQ